jgi:hypothetical protein
MGLGRERVSLLALLATARMLVEYLRDHILKTDKEMAAFLKPRLQAG